MNIERTKKQYKKELTAFFKLIEKQNKIEKELSQTTPPDEKMERIEWNHSGKIIKRLYKIRDKYGLTAQLETYLNTLFEIRLSIIRIRKARAEIKRQEAETVKYNNLMNNITFCVLDNEKILLTKTNRLRALLYSIPLYVEVFIFYLLYGYKHTLILTTGIKATAQALNVTEDIFYSEFIKDVKRKTAGLKRNDF